MVAEIVVKFFVDVVVSGNVEVVVEVNVVVVVVGGYWQLIDGINEPVLQLLVSQHNCALKVTWSDFPHIEQSAEHPYIM